MCVPSMPVRSSRGLSQPLDHVGALPVRQLVMSLAPPDEGIDEPQPGVGGRP